LTGKNVFRIGANTFYDQKNKIPMKIPEFKRSGIGLIVEFCGIPNGFPNLGGTACIENGGEVEVAMAGGEIAEKGNAFIEAKCGLCDVSVLL
jgi:hypothetical protein